MLPMQPLLSTKVRPPRLRARLVPRIRLVQRLQQAIHYPLTLLSAPAGSGKTTLLCSWLATERTPFCWLALDQDDNDPMRFWSYVATTLATYVPMHTVFSFLHAPQSPAREQLIATFINALATVSHEIVLILDDYHLIENDSIHNDITALLQHVPFHFHLVIATRTQPPFPISKLRADGHLLEFERTELSFNTTETTLLLNDIMQLALSPADIALLAQRSEGWVAGLQLAALSLQRSKDACHVLQSFTHDQRYVLDYLTDEVISQQPSDVQEFLLQTSILERLSSSLCNAVTGQDNSQRLLEYLEQANLFTIPLDDKHDWYRYHHLFADALRVHLFKLQASNLPKLHRRASMWYASNGLLLEAIAHAMHSDQPEYTAHLVEQAAPQFWLQGERQTIRRWLEALPHTLLEHSPRLCLYQAIISIYTHHALDAAERYLQQAEEQLDVGSSSQELQGEIHTVRALIATVRGEHVRAIHFCNSALSSLPAYSFWRGQLLYTLGLNHHHNGNDTLAITYINESIHLCTAFHDSTTLSNCYFLLAAIQQRQGQLRTAVKTAHLALITLQHTHTTATISIMLSAIYYEWNILDKALAYAQQCIDIGVQAENAQVTWLGNLHRARTLYAQGAREQALRLFEQTNQAGKKLNRERAMMSSVTFQAPFWLAERRLDVVASLVQEYSLHIEDLHDPLYISSCEVQARLCLARQEYTAAMQLIERIHEIACSHGWNIQVIQCLLLQAIILYSQGKVQQAITVMQRTLAQAEPEGYVRSIIDNGSLVKPLLLHLFEQKACPQTHVLSPHTIPNLLAAIGQTTPVSQQQPDTPLHGALSKRERDVLRLLADGCSDREIARRLIIGESTVASHMKRIYRKLDVHSRTQAVARARALHLL